MSYSSREVIAKVATRFFLGLIVKDPIYLPKYTIYTLAALDSIMHISLGIIVNLDVRLSALFTILIAFI
jgi:hypothetical protein